MVIYKLGKQSCCERQVWIARVLFSGSCSSSTLTLVCLFAGILNSSRAHPLDLIVETMKHSSFGKFGCVLLSFRRELESRHFFLCWWWNYFQLTVSTSLLRILCFNCIYYVLAFGQYLKHSCHSALELIISELNL